MSSGSSGECLYDVLFSMRDDEASETRKRTAIEKTFASVHEYALRLYSDKMSRRDKIHSLHVVSNGTLVLKLQFILLMLAHEPSQQVAIIESSVRRCKNPDDVKSIIERASAFYRILAIGARSVFETPFTERNADAILGAFLRFCLRGWIALSDSRTMTMHSRFFSGRLAVDDFERIDESKKSDRVDCCVDKGIDDDGAARNGLGRARTQVQNTTQ